MIHACLAACSFFALLGAAQLDPLGFPARLVPLLASLLAIASFRPVLPGGRFERVLAASGGFAALGGWLVGARAGHALALVAQAMLGGIFLVVADYLTLPRGRSRRLYGTSVVLLVVFPTWHMLAIWLPQVQFPRPPLSAAMGAEAMGALALALAFVLAAPGLGSLTKGLVGATAPVRKVPVPPDLELDRGASGALLEAAERDTVPAPPTPKDEEDHG